MKLTPANRSPGVAAALGRRRLAPVVSAPAQIAADQPEHHHDRVGQAGRNRIGDAAERGPRDGRQLRRAARQRGGALHRALRHDQRQQRRRRRVFECGGRSEHQHGDEDIDHVEPAGIGAPCQQQRRQRLGKLAGLQDPLALVTIRDVARHEHQQRGREKADQPDHAERERTAGQVIDLPAERHDADQAGEARQASREQKKQERSVREQMRRRRQASRRTFRPVSCCSRQRERTARPTSFVIHAVTDARPDVNGRLTPAYGIALSSMARPYWRKGCLGGMMLQLQSAFGVIALLALAWAFGENRRAVSLRQAAIGLFATILTAIVLIKLPFVTHAFGAINDAVGTIAAASRAGTSFVFGYLGGGALPFDLESARRGFHPGVPGAAGGADHERADHAVVLLAGAAADRARHGVAVGAHARRRRRGRAVHRRQYLSRHGGSAAVHPPLSGAAHPQRIVSGDDRRHGRHRRHRAGALRDLAGAADPGRRGAFCHRLGAGRAGRDPGQPDHGAGNLGQAHRRRA